MAIYDARHRQGFLAPLEGDLLDKAAHVASSDGIRETVTQLGFDVLPENPVELLRAPFFALDLLRQINLVELSDRPDALRSLPLRAWLSGDRSEEHTSELQSLMRISYAVFCLKKTTNTIHN